MLGAFSVSTLRRAADNAIDWFSLVLFTLALLAVWIYFGAWNTGVPPKMAASVIACWCLDSTLQCRWLPLRLRLPPRPGGLLLALVASAASDQRCCGAGHFLPPVGLAAVWVVVVSIYGAPIEYTRSYASTAAVLPQQVKRVGGDGCVQAHHLPVGVRAMLAYHGGVNFGPQFAAPISCRVAIHRDSERTSLATTNRCSAGKSLTSSRVARAMTKSSRCGCAIDEHCAGRCATSLPTRRPALSSNLGWPLFIANLALVGNGTIDTIMAGRLSATDLAAVAVGSSIYVSVYIGLMGVLQALSPIAGHHFGAQRWRAIGDDLQQALWLSTFPDPGRLADSARN